MKKIYSGVGSREISDEAKKICFEVGKQMALAGWTLRSGAAEGADTAFEQGALSVGGKCEIYLPWKGYSNHPYGTYDIPKEAFAIAGGHHNYYDRVSQGVQKLLARNVQILLGKNLDKPSELVLAWWNEESRGTRHTLSVAATYEIKSYNLADVSVLDLMRALAK